MFWSPFIVVYITSCAGLEGGGGPDPLENSNSLNSYSNITENMPSPSANAIISRTYPHPLGKIFWIVPDINWIEPDLASNLALLITSICAHSWEMHLASNKFKTLQHYALNSTACIVNIFNCSRTDEADNLHHLQCVWCSKHQTV